MNTTKFSLNAGELSDEMAGRIDLQKVQMGCEVAENVRVLRVGGQTRRAGLGHVGGVYDNDTPSRLRGFRFSGEQGYVLEFSAFKMRVLFNGALVESGGSPVEYTTPWDGDQVFALQFAQRVDKIIVTHPNVEVYTITRNADATWTIAVFPWQERVWELATDAVVALRPLRTTGFTILSSSVGIFDASWVGSRIRLGHVRPEIPTSKTISTVITGIATAVNLASGVYTAGTVVYATSSGYTRPNGKYGGVPPLGSLVYWTVIANYTGATDYTGDSDPDLYPNFFMTGVVAFEEQDVLGGWSFETEGTWLANIAIERSFDEGVTWNPVKLCSTSGAKNFLVQDTETSDSNASFRVLLLDSNNNAPTINAKLTFTTSSVFVYGVALIIAYGNSTTISVEIEKDFEEASSTTEWYEDAFNPRNGYPKTCTFHQKRLFFGGSGRRPQTIWASRIRRPFDFTQGTLADDGLSFETEAVEYESVLWLVSHLSLLVGTTSGVWAITSPNGLSITPENNAIVRQVRHGVQEGFPGIPLQNNVMFLQTKGRKIHELTGGSVEYGGYTDVDVTQLASHITRGGVTQITSGQVPDAALYLVVGGQIALLTYERAQNVVGWTRWVTDGAFESIATCPGAGEDDDVYVTVLRDGQRCIEYLAPDMLRVEEAGDMPNLTFLDSYIRKEEETAFTVFDGLDHLEGRSVEVFGDGEPLGAFTVTGGEVTLTYAVNNAIAGLPYTSLITTMPLDQGTIGNKSSVMDLVVRFRNSLGAETSQDGINWSKVNFEQPRIDTNSPPVLITGDVQTTLHSTWQRKPTISIRQKQPLPMTVLAIRINGKTSK